MAYIVSAGELTQLDRPDLRVGRKVDLSQSVSQTYAEIWRTQPQVRTVVSFIARNIGQIGMHLFERTSDTDRRRLTDHPLAALIRRPNPRTTRFRMVDALVQDMCIYDVAAWAKLKTDSQPRALLRLAPSKLEPVGNSWQWPEQVKFKGASGSRTFELDELVLFRGYSPDRMWGESPMETLRRILEEEFRAGEYRTKLWRNGARVPGYIKRPAKTAWSTTARKTFRDDWDGLYSGDGPATGGTPILEDGMDWVPAGITPEQAEYMAARKLTREEVAAAFHVPLPMVGILDHATFSNIKEQHQQLYQDCLGPWLTMIQEELALQLVPDFDDSGRLYIEFNMAEKLKGSFEEQATQLQTAVGGPWLTRNEARARQNLPAIDGGDDLITPLNVITGGQASPTDSAPKSDAVLRLAAFLARQGGVIKSRIGAGKGWGDGFASGRWDQELVRDLGCDEQTAALINWQTDTLLADGAAFDAVFGPARAAQLADHHKGGIRC